MAKPSEVALKFASAWVFRIDYATEADWHRERANCAKELDAAIQETSKPLVEAVLTTRGVTIAGKAGRIEMEASDWNFMQDEARKLKGE